MAFDPDAFLAETDSNAPRFPVSGRTDVVPPFSFSPDAFLAETAPLTGRIEAQRGIPVEELVAQTRAGVGQFPQRAAPPTGLSLVPGIGPALALAMAPESEAFARAVLSGATAGLTEAAGQRLAPAPITAEDIQFQAPIATMLGEIAGGVAPTGRIIRGAQTLRQLSRLGAGSGGALGGAGGLSSALQGQEPVDIGEALTSTLAGAGLGALAGGALGVVPGVGRRIAERFGRTQIRRDVPALVTDSLNPTSNIAKRRIDQAIESGQIDKTIGLIKRETKGSPRDIEGALTSVDKTKESLGNKINNFSENNKDIRFSSEDAVAQIRSVLDTPEARIVLESDPVLKDAIEARVRNLEALELTPKSLLDRLRGYNSLEKNYLQKSTAGIATPNDDILHDALIAERDALSDIADRKIREITGKDENFYRQYGQVSEFGNYLDANRLNLVTQRRKDVGKGIIGQALSGVDISRPSTYGKVLSPLTGGELERVNQNVRRLFQRVPEAAAAVDLPPVIP